MFNDDNSYCAARKVSPVIRVVWVTADNFKWLIENKILNEIGTAIDPSRNANPSQVNIGDYLRVDNLNDIYPINHAYFHENFDVV